MFIYYFNLMVHYPAEGCGFYTKAERFHKTLNNGKHLENLDCRDICFILVLLGMKFVHFMI